MKGEHYRKYPENYTESFFYSAIYKIEKMCYNI